MEIDNPISTPTKHGSFEDTADENDNKMNAKRIKCSPTMKEERKMEGDIVNKEGELKSNVSKPDAEGKTSQRLDVPSKELQCIQKQVLIEKLMSSSTSQGAMFENNLDEPMDTESGSTYSGPRNATVSDRSKSSFKKPYKIPNIQEMKTFKLQSSVLAKVKSFLPEMKTANEQLLRLPDPSKISLESDSDRDETDGPGWAADSAVPGSSASFKKTDDNSKDTEGKTFVEMNIALVDHSDSDTSSDGEDFVPSKMKTLASPKKSGEIISKEDSTTLSSSETTNSKETLTPASENNPLITELN